MNEIETTLESAPVPRSPVRRAVVRRHFEPSKSGDAMPILLTVDDAADLLRTTRVRSTRCSNAGNCLE